MRHCERAVVPRKAANVPAVHGKEAALVGAEPLGMCEPVGCQPEGSEGASPMRADESDAANLPREWGRSQEAHGEVRRAWGPDFVGVAPRLSRRGFLLDVPCHWHCSTNGHARQLPM